MYRKYIDKIHKSLVKKGYELNELIEGSNRVFNYKKKEFGRLLRVGFILSDEGKEISFWGFSVYINYLHLEVLVAPILVKNELIGRTKASDIYSSVFNQNEFRIPVIKNKAMITKEDIHEVNEIFNKFYSESILPFFEKWHSLYTLYEFIRDKEDREELHPILGQFWQFKKAAIFRLCNDERYPDYMNLMYETERKYFEEDPSDIDNVRYFNAAKELKEVLDKTQPIYNI